MKKFLSGLVMGLLIAGAAAIFFSHRAADLSKYNAELKASYERQAAATAAAKSERDRDREAWAKERATAELAAAAAAARAGELTAELKKSKLEAAEISAAAAELRTEVQPAIDANPQLKKYVDLILTGSAKKDEIIFSLELRDAERIKTIAAKDLEISSWKLEAGSWRQDYFDEHGLRLAGEQRIRGLELQLGRGRLKYLAYGFGGGLAARTAYTVIRALLKK